MQTVKRLKLLPLAIFLALALAILITPTPAFACSTVAPAPGKPTPIPPSLLDHVRTAEIVVEGTATNANWSHIPYANLKIARYFKGSGPAVVKLTGFDNPAFCGYIPINQKVIFYLEGDPKSELKAVFLTGEASTFADPVTISLIIAATGHNPTLPIEASASLAVSSPASKSEQTTEIITLFITGFLVMAAGVVGIFMWRNRSLRR